MFKLVCAMEMISDAVINNRRVNRLTVTEYETLRLYSTFLCYKNVCFEIMNWKYEFIDITLILTINYDILVTLNDLIFTSTILVNLVTSDHVNSSSCLFKTEDNCQIYACFAPYQSSSECSASGNTDEIFIYINEYFFFLTDLLGYMIIQIFYKQLLLTHIYRH